LSLADHAAVIGEESPYERARKRRRERREQAAIPDGFSAEDLITAPWETGAGGVALIDRFSGWVRHDVARPSLFTTTTSKEVTCRRPLRPSCWPRRTTPPARSWPLSGVAEPRHRRHGTCHAASVWVDEHPVVNLD
jgi:hypothetical protein